MAEIKISCEHCGQHIQCNDGYRGMQIDCPSCRRVLQVPAAKKSHKQVVAEITEANRVENKAESENQKSASNSVGGLLALIIIWPLFGVVAFFLCALFYEWEIDAALIFIFGLIWIGAGLCLGVLVKLISKAASSSNSCKKLDDTVKNLPSTAGQWDKKFPKFPWAGIAGLVLLVTMLCRHWDGVSHFFGSVKTSIGATANSIQSSLVSSSIRGGVYVTTRNGNAVKMSGIQVFALEETALRKRIQEINGTIQSDFQTSLEKAGVKESDTWFLEEKASWEAGLVNDKIINFGTAGFYSTTTDADGNYTFPKVIVGSYCVIARAMREVGNETEYHLWRSTTTAQAGGFKIDLENSSDLLNANSFVGDIERNGLSQDYANQAKRGISDGYWASIMINNYGLNLPVIYR